MFLKTQHHSMFSRMIFFYFFVSNVFATVLGYQERISMGESDLAEPARSVFSNKFQSL